MKLPELPFGRFGVGFILCACVLTWAQPTQLEGELSFASDGFAATIGKAKAGIQVPVTPTLKLGADLEFLYTQQDYLFGILPVYERAVSGLFDIDWSLFRNHIQFDIRAGADVVQNWKTHPHLDAEIRAKVPLPPYWLLKNLRISPRTWYYPHVPFATAINNRVTSYGYEGEISGALGGKSAFAINYRHNVLEPESSKIDTSAIDTSIIRYPYPSSVSPTFTLPVNRLQNFYAYIYYRVLKPLYLGYAFSYITSAIDRNMVTSLRHLRNTSHEGTVYKIERAPFPYPTFKNLRSHMFTIAYRTSLTDLLTWTTNASIPLYSNQDIRYIDKYTNASGYPQAIHLDYPFYAQENTAPLTFKSKILWKFSPRTHLTFHYDYFGFPYEEWAYFTADSYSLHTAQLSIKQLL